jgi:hypothetical protein
MTVYTPYSSYSETIIHYNKEIRLTLAEKSSVLRDHHPLQQGLRHQTLSTTNCAQRPSSITTRIKTLLNQASAIFCPSETIIHYNKD